MTTPDGVRCEVTGGVLCVTLSRPGKANALRSEDMTVLLRALEDAAAGGTVRAVLLRAEGRNFCGGADLVTANAPGGERPPLGAMIRGLAAVSHRLVQTLWDLPVPAVAATGGTVRAVLIRAEGRNFCGGADLVTANAPGRERPALGTMIRNLAATSHRLVRTLWDLPVPAVAAVQGRATGLGLHLALACDFVVAAETATFSEPFAQRGFTADSGATYLLPRLVGVARAKQMLIRGLVVPAPRALEWGLIGDMVAEADLAAVAKDLAVELAAGPTLVHGLTKALISDHLTADLPRALAAEARTVELSLRGEDFKEGIRAFLGSRVPAFTGR